MDQNFIRLRKVLVFFATTGPDRLAGIRGDHLSSLIGTSRFNGKRYLWNVAVILFSFCTAEAGASTEQKEIVLRPVLNLVAGQLHSER